MDIFDYISSLNNGSKFDHLFDYLKDNHDNFVEAVRKSYGLYFLNAGLIADIDENKLLECFVLWKNDLKRIKEFEMSDSHELDHFKHAAHMVYWLRRALPVISIQPAEEDLTEVQLQEQQLLFKYANQYCAFDFGFKLCAFFEANRVDSKVYFSEMTLSYDYKQVASHFLKTKNVSPHALFLIYKGVFFNPTV